MKVNILCPQCNQKYSLQKREGLERKRVRCKKCQHQFRIGEAMGKAVSIKQNESSPKEAPEPPVLAHAAGPQKTAISDLNSPSVSEPQSAAPPQPVAPSQPAVPKDMSVYFLDASQQSPTERLRSGVVTQPPPTHIRNPLIVFAILGAIASSLLLAGVALAFRFYKFSEVSQIAQNKIVEQAEAPEVHAPSIQIRNAMPPPSEMGLVPSLQRAMPAGPTSSEIAPTPRPLPRQADDLQQIETRRKKVQEEIRWADEELARLDKRQEKKSKQQKVDFESKWAAERAKREERLLKVKQLKLHLRRMEAQADDAPLKGLIARIPVDGWGVNSLALSNKRHVFLGMNEGIQVFDWKRKKIISTIDRSDRGARVEHVCLNQAGNFLAAANSEGQIEIFKIGGSGSLKRIKQFDTESRHITFIAFDKSGSRLVSANRKGEVSLWDLRRARIITTSSLGDRRTGKLIAFDVDTENATARFTNGKTWKVIRFSDGELVESGNYPFSTSHDGIFLPDQRGMVQVSGSSLYVMQEDHPEPVLELKGNGVQWTIANAGDTHFLSGGNKRIYQWALGSGELTHVWSIPDASYIKTIVMSPDGSKMAATSGSASQDVYVFDFQ